MTSHATPCRVGLWGAFGVEDHGQALYTMVMRAELARRLPAGHVRVFAPLGPGRPTRADRGEPAEPLGEWSDAELDFVVVGGSGLAETGNRFLVTGPGSEVPVRWHVTDPADEAALRKAGVDGRVDVTPHPAVLLPRHLDPAVLAKRLEYLRVMGWYPRDGAALVVQGADATMASEILQVLGDHPGMTPVVAELQEGDGRLAEALSGAPVHRLPASVSTEDVAAALSAAGGFVGSSLAGCLTAAGYGRPWVMLALGGPEPPPGVDDEHLVRAPHQLHEAFARAVKAGAAPETLEHEVDAFLDALAAEAAAAGAARHPDGLPDASRRALEAELVALRRAYRARVERGYQERVVLADHAARGAPEDVERLRRRLAEAEAELAALRNTRTFRWTETARSAYRTLRERRR